VARLLLGEALALEVEVGSPSKRGAVLHEKLTFDPRALMESGVAEALMDAGASRLLLPDGSERTVRLTSTDGIWQGRLSIAS
jgi:hypothetical protein